MLLRRERESIEREREKVFPARCNNGGGGEREVVRRSSAEAHDGIAAARNVPGVRLGGRSQHYQGQGYARFSGYICFLLTSHCMILYELLCDGSQCVI